MIVQDVPFLEGVTVYRVLTVGITWIALLLTLISLVDYVWKNKDVMKDTK